MIRFKKLLLLFCSLFMITTIVTSCDDGNNDSSTNTNGSFVDPVVDEITEGSYSGWLSDIVIMNRYLGHDSTYSFTYNAPNGDINLKMKSSDESVLTVEKSSSASNTYNFITHNPGNAVLTIYDSTDYLYFRKIIRVRTAYTEETIKEAAYDNDIYVGFNGFGGSYRLNCTKTSSSFEWQLQGKDEVEVNGMDIVFDCTYLLYYEPWDMYAYSASMVSEHENNQTDIIYLYISRTADMINLYYDIGGGEDALLNVFSPQSLSSMRPGF